MNCLLLLGALALAATPAPAAADRDARISVKLRRWQATGVTRVLSNVKLPEAMVDPPLADIRIGDTYEYSAPAQLTLLTVEARPIRWLSFDVQYGADDFSGAKATDRTWIHTTHGGTLEVLATGYVFQNPDHESIQIFESRNDGKARYVAINAYLRLLSNVFRDFYDGEYTHSTDLLAGYSRYEQSTVRRDGILIYTTTAFGPPPPNGPFRGLDSSYRARWEALGRFGFREQIGFPWHGFGVQAQVVGSPFTRFRGEGFDSLDGGLSSGRPNFRDSIDGGMVELEFAVTWSPLRFASLEAGYSRWMYRSRGRGTRVKQLRGGETEKSELEEVRADNGGFFIGASARF